MIRAIRRRFIRIALAVLALAMVLVVGIINVANWVNVRAELTETLSWLVDADGQGGRKGGKNRHMRNTLSESGYFSALVRPDGAVALEEAVRIDDDSDALTRVAEQALSSGKSSGFVGDYLFTVSPRPGGRSALFLNCETRLTRVRRLALISGAACVGCILLACLLVSLFSSRAIRPLVENAVMQKQFITDAGHELKTPLTVISANMDVLSLEVGKNEWVSSTQKQVAAMKGLVNELIYLSRLDEEDARLEMATVDLSKLVRDTAEPFIGMAEFSGKSLDLDIEDGIRITGDAAALSRLASILCDNAVKYAPEGDTIEVSLKHSGKSVVFQTENALDKPMDAETMRRLFDRFYRADASRSRESGGYGIGLSVARAIAEKHGGTIKASQEKPGRIAFVCSLKG